MEENGEEGSDEYNDIKDNILAGLLQEQSDLNRAISNAKGDLARAAAAAKEAAEKKAETERIA